MIKYALACACGYKFDAWFPNSDSYDDQRAKNLVQCPLCDGTTVSKQIMSPAITRGRRGDPKRDNRHRQNQEQEREQEQERGYEIPDNAGGACPQPPQAEPASRPSPPSAGESGPPPSPQALEKYIAAAREHIRENYTDVGDKFADEATAMHDGDAPERPIYGRATKEEVKTLVENEIPIAPLPDVLAPLPPKKIN